MRSIRESAIERKVVDLCRVRGYYCRKFSSPQQRGVPDRIICHGGKALFLELKRPGKEPTALQYREQRLLREAGMKAAWAADFQSALEIIDDFFTEEVL